MTIKVERDEYGDAFITVETKVKVYFPTNFENIPESVSFEYAGNLIMDEDLTTIGASALENMPDVLFQQSEDSECLNLF